MTVHQIAMEIALTGRNIPWRTGPGEWKSTCPCCDRFAALTIVGVNGIHGAASTTCANGCTEAMVLAALEQEHTWTTGVAA